MFCSNCGDSLFTGDQVCPRCNSTVPVVVQTKPGESNVDEISRQMIADYVKELHRPRVTFKIAILSALSFVITIGLLIALDYGLIIYINELIFDMLDWFNRKSTVFKIIFSLFLGVAIISWMFKVATIVAGILGTLIFYRLPFNKFTAISSLILCGLNIIYLLYFIWQTPSYWDFWIIVEMVFISWFIVFTNIALIVHPKSFQQ